MDHEISSINFKIISLNVRGLNKIFKWLHRQTAHCYFLQETFSTEQSINTWRSEWGGNIFYSHGSNHSKGVMILVNPRSQLEVMRSTKDKNGRSVMLEIKLDNRNLVLANVYAPNDIPQQVKFYQDLNQTLLTDGIRCLPDMSLAFITLSLNSKIFLTYLSYRSIKMSA